MWPPLWLRPTRADKSAEVDVADDASGESKSERYAAAVGGGRLSRSVWRKSPAPRRRVRRDRGPRVLLYSHDTFGLGHLRRSRAIAIALTQAFPDISILIVTGSPIVGRFDFPSGVDFVRVPGVVKLPTGEYATHNLSLPIAETTELRQDIILSTARRFTPDLAIIDKEPTGFRGEITPTLELLKHRDTRVVLGVRDVLDEPEALSAEWDRKEAMRAVEEFYNEIWVYGLREIYDPLAGLRASADVRSRVRYTGYLHREPPDWPDPAVTPPERPPYVLITAGGGGDGDWLMDWALTAYENDPTLDQPAVMVFGPFMNVERRRDFERRAARFRDDRGDFVRQPSGAVDAGGAGRRCNGRLQHVLRGAFLRQTRRDRAAHLAAAGAIHSGESRGETRACAPFAHARAGRRS